MPLLDEGNSALVRVRPEPRGWDHPWVLWRSRDDPEGEPLFALKDTAEGGAGTPSSNTISWRSGRYGRPYPWWPTTFPESPRFAFSFLALRCPFLVLLQSMTLVLLPQELEAWSLGKSVFLRGERGVWDQL